MTNSFKPTYSKINNLNAIPNRRKEEKEKLLLMVPMEHFFEFLVSE